ncbi:Uu.00g021850.m01.CDS01 [Anthostomella pinea]|uniref:Uu.00g021850.m01.CDS01 n=1 Tax=Anthostomella pinea TaxID=933095 RepID=A0AAI8VTX2_9PEZI|nr:Uu.00g021850.m01.CDS01 [Anthostomella pinea]
MTANVMYEPLVRTVAPPKTPSVLTLGLAADELAYAEMALEHTYNVKAYIPEPEGPTLALDGFDQTIADALTLYANGCKPRSPRLGLCEVAPDGTTLHTVIKQGSEGLRLVDAKNILMAIPILQSAFTKTLPPNDVASLRDILLWFYPEELLFGTFNPIGIESVLRGLRSKVRSRALTAAGQMTRWFRDLWLFVFVAQKVASRVDRAAGITHDSYNTVPRKHDGVVASVLQDDGLTHQLWSDYRDLLGDLERHTEEGLGNPWVAHD